MDSTLPEARGQSNAKMERNFRHADGRKSQWSSTSRENEVRSIGGSGNGEARTDCARCLEGEGALLGAVAAREEGYKELHGELAEDLLGSDQETRGCHQGLVARAGGPWRVGRRDCICCEVGETADGTHGASEVRRSLL